jgi:peptidoglycan-associated lipoprotein
MSYKILGLFAAVALLSACETATTAGGSSGGSGAGGSGAGVSNTSTQQSATKVVPGSQEDLVISVGDSVYFEFNKFSLRADARNVLERQAAWLKSNPSVTFAVEGHCDERGTREFNLALGARRANSVKDYLVTLGINPVRIKTISYGKERPVAMGSNNAAWAQNRRGITRLTGAGS